MINSLAYGIETILVFLIRVYLILALLCISLLCVPIDIAYWTVRFRIPTWNESFTGEVINLSGVTKQKIVATWRYTVALIKGIV